ncbi:5-formyltetrahydrofolate cyclo-ligase [Pleurocapsa sp. CCALA 161]|uniref:5-formyltetrahydrofolate cyclo-ligase n=1 Tax=Pleurocapsa sp. CCALA 161 TaxID=2107688 RepID=UPI000D062D0C|nr:5-formyltetrahydrofolate cyclo-ligase [Pleurocapsa sp. CCALA 161]PSB07213.1 5-formyltetrahydrofolate cyclo-ligase [Pleurocapsa sp. CCALA 161]
MPSLDKSALRREILQQRQLLSLAEWQVKSNQICDRLKSITLFQEAQTILAYFSIRQEPDLAPLFSLDKNWAFPRCVGKSLVWHCWQPGTELKIGKYGIQEPHENSTIVDPATADLILVPTVACDAQGYRLGYGGGFYDRLLSRDLFRTGKTNHNLNIATIGILFDFADEVQLTKDPWDMKLNFICTETKFKDY